MFLTSFNEAREEIEKAQNPLFLYDNDTDGLCSFVILRKFLGRGEGVAVKSYPDLSEQYLDKIDKMNADSAIVLDIHSLSEKFLEGAKERGINIIWIDHHQNEHHDKTKKIDFVFYFNPVYTVKKGKNSKPTSFQTHMISRRDENAWLSLVGCIADAHLPDFTEDVVRKHQHLWGNGIKTAFDAYYKTDLGKIALMLNFVLKDIPSRVKEAQDYLIKCENPEMIIREESNPVMKERTADLYKKYLQVVDEADKHKEGRSIVFTYGGEVSMSSEISNALMYRHPKDFIAIAYRRQGIVNISMRGKNVKNILDSILKKIPNSTGGGHQDAVGARIQSQSWEEFEKLFNDLANGFK